MKALLSIVGIIVLLWAMISYNQNQTHDLFWLGIGCLLLFPAFFAVCVAISKNTQPPNYR